MQKLKERLAALARSLGIQEALRVRAVRRMTARHKEQLKFERQKEQVEDVAAALRKRAMQMDYISGAPLFRKAYRKDEKVQRLQARVDKACSKAIVWKGRARVLKQRIEGIETKLAEIKAEIAELSPKVDLEKQTCRGGEFDECWRLSNLTSAQRCAEGKRATRYSQAGPPDIRHPYGPGPGTGTRDDCSTYNTSQALATGAQDMNDEDFRGPGFTGTQTFSRNGWKQVSLQQMINARQGYVIYGSGTGHHVECYCPSESDPFRTVGHGSAPVDFGTVHLFGSGEVERYFIYDPS